MKGGEAFEGTKKERLNCGNSSSVRINKQTGNHQLIYVLSLAHRLDDRQERGIYELLYSQQKCDA